MTNPDWEAGNSTYCKFSVKDINSSINNQLKNNQDWILLWDFSIGKPNLEYIQFLTNQSGDIYHLGLLLGLGDLPKSLDYILPNWMLILNPDSSIQSTSWKISPQACLIRTVVFKQMNSLDVGYVSPEYAWLDFGFRSLKRGLITRHDPNLLLDGTPKDSFGSINDDEVYFITINFSLRWLIWVLLRMWIANEDNGLNIITTIRKYKSLLPVAQHKLSDKKLINSNKNYNHKLSSMSISVIIPTINRYKYLDTLLHQLNNQTILPLEVLIIDQTVILAREKISQQNFPELNLKILYLDSPGQSSARNVGIENCAGEFIVFCDDDIEVKPNFIESHIRNYNRYNTGIISCGTAIESEINKLYFRGTYPRISEGFPGGNSFLPKKYLMKNGLFDRAFDKGMRADRDLGVRLYLKGYILILDPTIIVLHHKAPIGGLREHNQRKITFYGSRQKITAIHLPSVSDFYISMRYFSFKQNREMLWVAILGTFANHGNLLKQCSQIVISTLCLPIILLLLRKRMKTAKNWFDKYPQIPSYNN